MGLFDFFFKFRHKGLEADELITNAETLTKRFMNSAPVLKQRMFIRDEVYLFCCWIVLDYTTNYGYLKKDKHRCIYELYL